ncbi:hypothetical protein ABW20_dc0106439 [Dactylellina cionopaga]|nr:hypothetical protein ABW20_dc0106439 [Dactylellina cionopaga]
MAAETPVATSCPQVEPLPDLVPSPAPSYLLVIPPEIREIIYSWFFDITQAPNEHRDACNPVVASPPNFWDRGPNCDSVYPPEAPTKYSLLPILQTCQQIRSEFQSFLARPSKREVNTGGETRFVPKSLRYVLDVNAYSFSVFPVWRVLPLPPEEPYNLIEELRVNYLVKNFTLRNMGRFYGAGGPGMDCAPLFYMCNYFFCHGPQWYYKPAINNPGNTTGEKHPLSGGRCNPHIKRLVFDVTFEYQEDVQEKLDQLKADHVAQKEGAEEELATHLRYRSENERRALTLGIDNWFGQMVSIGYFDGHVEKVVLLCNGKPLEIERYSSDESVYDNEYTVENGFRKSPGWEPSSMYEGHGYNWGPKEEFVRKPASRL